VTTLPRGTRAVPAPEAELHNNLHHDGATTHTFVSPAVSVLDVMCWCERSVVSVPQWQVRWLGVTLSCGNWDCTPPDGDDVYVTQSSRQVHTEGYLTDVITRRYDGSEWAQRRRDRDRSRYVQRVLPPGGGRPVGGHQAVIAERRDRVIVAWRAGRRPKDIADDLGVTVQTIYADLRHVNAQVPARACR
jgi:DNA-binding CsgD family transcriptional regulator